MKNKIPQHVAIIMDGNGRWAKERKLPLAAGHKKGADTAYTISKCAHELGVKWLTLYTFSTENWKRPASWLADYNKLLQWYLDSETKQLVSNNIKLHIIGDVSKFSTGIQNGLSKAIEETQNCTGLNLVLALNYGARDEITTAIKNIAQQICDKKISVADITNDTVSQFLYTKNMPDPDLLIRTSGEQRISNYLLWQIAYSELKFTEKLWPDYTAKDFAADVLDYQKRDRRYGQYTDAE
jgi:undecaprenyl diphosphate synthase